MVIRDRGMPKKIHIIGSVGSGKTTLARKLSTKLSIPFYELDNVVRMRQKNTQTGSNKRSPEERDALFHQIISQDKWIVEGVQSGWVNPGFERADVILFLDPSMNLRRYRIVRRFVLQKLGLEKAHYKPTWEIFRKMFQWNHSFEYETKPQIMKVLKMFPDKVIIITRDFDIGQLR